jgi:large subunit ribosomal protein L22
MRNKKNKTEDKLNTARSVNKNIRSSTRKLNPILKAIVGKKVDIAIRNLTFSDKRISQEVKKTLSSAVANAENNFQYDIDKLIVKEAYCGKQIVMKRFRPRAKGRAERINKRTSHLTIELESVEE